MAQPSPATFFESCCIAIAELFNQRQCYAVIGSAAVTLFGGTRTTSGVDIVVPRGQNVIARDLLLEDAVRFNVDVRGDPNLAVSLKTPVRIHSQPYSFTQYFGPNTATIQVPVRNVLVTVLHPIELLNQTCALFARTGSGRRRAGHSRRIIYLLLWLHSMNLVLTRQDLPNATPEFVDGFVAEYFFRWA